MVGWTNEHNYILSDKRPESWKYSIKKEIKFVIILTKKKESLIQERMMPPCRPKKPFPFPCPFPKKVKEIMKFLQGIK